MTAPTVSLLSPFGFTRGFPKVRRVPDPAAGSSVVLTVPGSENWRVVSVYCNFATSAVVANRMPVVYFSDPDGSRFAEQPCPNVVPASGVIRPFWGIGAGNGFGSNDGSRAAGLLDVILPGGFRVEVGGTNLDVADAITGITLFTEVFLIGAGGYPVGPWPDAVGISPPVP
jgi:hypothetical protein